MKNNIISALGLIGVGVLSGCGGGGNNAVTTVPTAHLAITLPAGTAKAGVPYTFTVNALDANNAAVPTYAGTVQITASDKSATLPANATLARGTGTFTVTFSTSGSYTITASDTVGNATAGTSAAVSVSFTPRLAITLTGGTVAAAAPFSFTVNALDGTNAVDSTFSGTVLITTSDVSAAVPANATLARGTGTFTVTFGTIGSYTITASDTAGNYAAGTSAAVSVTSAPLAVSLAPQVAALPPGGQQAFTGYAIPQGDGTSNFDVTWRVQEGPGGGSITAAGVYTAPAAVGTYHVIAASVANPASSATATVNVFPGGIATTPTGSMHSAHGAYTATLLANGPATTNGKVLIVGGNDAWYRNNSGPTLRGITGAELYDPLTGTFAPTGSMHSPRYAHTATLLPNGKVLVAGGVGDGGNLTQPPVNQSAELYDPTTGTFIAIGRMRVPRINHTATLIAGGRVLIVGGLQDLREADPYNVPEYPYYGPGLITAEIYDIATGVFTATGSMSTARYGHTATLLPDGTVLIAGGITSSDIDGGVSTATAEIYHPSTNTFTPTGSMHAVRDLHVSTLLSNGKVLVTGGNRTAPSAEIFDPATGTFSLTGNMAMSRSAHTATPLSNGEVLVAGGATTPQCVQLGIKSGIDSGQCGAMALIELFDPANGTFTPHGFMHIARLAHTATLLSDGEVLLAGGELDATAELYP